MAVAGQLIGKQTLTGHCLELKSFLESCVPAFRNDAKLKFFLLTVLELNFPFLVTSLYFRESLCVFSTAAQQRSTGDECGPEDPRDEPKHPLSDCALEHKAIKLEEQVRDLTERYRKALADSENVRRRTQKFVEDAKLFGIQSFCRDLVEVADILEKTAESAAEEAEPTNPNPTLQKIYEGLSLIEAKLQSVFAKHGLQKMSPVGDKYDPYDHEIVCHVPAEGMQPGTIALVTQDGYKLHGRTIRHALVGVAVESQE
ncbi:grpE protein homolog 2, mitochondrial [Meleagris gallopavo]|uniref:grpE protein homolog 2, mitochondrial n=1 Tax=Meleagris gallopavo TaxID=9103 RepID=UPI0012AB78BC|nr:grpE protein homolog 2, mitochondrial [Meleagris gallopavo]